MSEHRQIGFDWQLLLDPWMMMCTLRCLHLCCVRQAVTDRYLKWNFPISSHLFRWGVYVFLGWSFHGSYPGFGYFESVVKLIHQMICKDARLYESLRRQIYFWSLFAFYSRLFRDLASISPSPRSFQFWPRSVLLSSLIYSACGFRRVACRRQTIFSESPSTCGLVGCLVRACLLA